MRESLGKRGFLLPFGEKVRMRASRQGSNLVYHPLTDKEERKQ
jgi:hypothetical protein